MDLDPKRLLVLHMLAEELDGAAHAVPVEIGTVDQFERYCAAEILRSDDPTRAGRPESRFASSLAHESPTHAGLLRCGLHPDLLPYHVLWWDCLEQQGPSAESTARHCPNEICATTAPRTPAAASWTGPRRSAGPCGTRRPTAPDPPRSE